MKRKPTRVSRKLLQLSIAAALSTPFTMAQATEVDFGTRDIDARWNNTLKYSAATRLGDLDEKVAGTSYNPNLDGGDRNFDKGLISNRVDVLTEFDFRYKRKVGFRISAAGWYDDVYHNDTDHDSVGPPTVKGIADSQFPDDTVDLHGGDIELLDAFVFGKTKIAGRNLSVKVGQFAQLYGESLFFGANGVANAQASPDIIKALSVPSSQVKEILRPVQQIALNYKASSNVSLGGYYMFEWEKARIPGTGSYFAFADFPGAGGNVLYTPIGVLDRTDDIDASDSGQFGLQMKYRQGDSDTEYGFYITRHHDKFAQFYIRPALLGADDTYALVFAEDIETYGVSMSTLIGETNVAAEISHRRNTPLMAVGNIVADPTGTGDGDKNPLYPVGETWHLNISAISVLRENALWDGATFLGEIIYNERTSIDKNADQLDPNATKSASAFRVLLQPEYFQVRPGVDLQVPISLGYGISGRSSVLGAGAMPPEKGGDLSIGLKADFSKVWQMGLNYTHYFGDASGVVDANANISYGQFHKDRDFLAFNIQRTF